MAVAPKHFCGKTFPLSVDFSNRTELKTANPRFREGFSLHESYYGLDFGASQVDNPIPLKMGCHPSYIIVYALLREKVKFSNVTRLVFQWKRCKNRFEKKINWKDILYFEKEGKVEEIEIFVWKLSGKKWKVTRSKKIKDLRKIILEIYDEEDVFMSWNNIMMEKYIHKWVRTILMIHIFYYWRIPGWVYLGVIQNLQYEENHGKWKLREDYS